MTGRKEEISPAGKSMCRQRLLCLDRGPALSSTASCGFFIQHRALWPSTKLERIVPSHRIIPLPKISFQDGAVPKRPFLSSWYPVNASIYAPSQGGDRPPSLGRLAVRPSLGPEMYTLSGTEGPREEKGELLVSFSDDFRVSRRSCGTSYE